MSSTMTRRSFFAKAAAASTAGFAATISLPASAIEVAAVPAKWDQTFDIVVIGSGGAGFTSAVAAAEAGAKVCILEKNSFVGGNTIVSGGAYNAVVPEDCKKAGITDSEELFFENTMQAGGYRGSKELVKVLTQNADEAVAWLKQHGVEFMGYVYQVYGGLHPRTRNPKLQGGQSYIKALGAYVDKLGIKLLTSATVENLIREEPLAGRVLGVQVKIGKETQYIRARKAVIAATGGFAANAKMCGLHDPRLEHLGTSNLPSATGEVLKYMINLGAETVGMDYIQCVINRPSDMKKYYPMSIFVDYFIFVNWEGKRFIPEDAPRDQLCDAFLKQTKEQAFSIMDAKGFEVHCTQGRVGDLLQSGVDAGEIVKADTIEALADKMGVPRDAVKQSVDAYNASVDSKKDALGRDASMLTRKIEAAPFYATRFAMARHHTMGGVLINARAQVIDRDGEVIPGLYAAGEVTGGVHGNNRVGGNGIADAFTFGLIAGRNAVK